MCDRSTFFMFVIVGKRVKIQEEKTNQAFSSNVMVIIIILKVSKIVEKSTWNPVMMIVSVF